MLRSLATALGFCTRLAPSRIMTGAQLAAGLPWFPFVGAIIGLLLALPPALGLLHPWPWIMAWLLAGANVWITRGLHWDGWADLWDGWGSCAQGKRFWEILKDSRAGVFGVLGLVLGLIGQVALFQAMLQREALGALVFCPLLGRCAVPVLALICRRLGRPGMGRDFLIAARWPALLPVAFALLAAGLWLVSWPALGLSLLLLGCFLWRLWRLAEKQAGCNGDFLGASIIGGELAAGLGWALMV